MADYYEELGITRSATDSEIKKGFRKLALKYHPDKDNSVEASTAFSRVAEAYDVLNDPKKKGFYDLYGEEGLKVGVSDGKGGKKGGFYSFSQTPLAVFESFFGTANPFAALLDVAEGFSALTFSAPKNVGKTKVLPCTVTLEELFFGCSKKITHTKKVLTAGNKVEESDKVLTFQIKPGSEDGTRYVFEGEGNEKPGMDAGPAVVVLSCAAHDSFERDGSNLICHKTIPLVQALAGTTVSINTLDLRTLRILLTDVVETGSVKVIPGEGMPTFDGGKGDLKVVFHVKSPARLTPVQKTLISAALYLPAGKLTQEQDVAVTNFCSTFANIRDGWSTGFEK